MSQPRKVPVTMRALKQRLNRRLRSTGRLLVGRAGRPGRAGNLYALVDTTRNVVLTADVDLAALGRQLKALAPYERLTD